MTYIPFSILSLLFQNIFPLSRQAMSRLFCLAFEASCQLDPGSSLAFVVLQPLCSGQPIFLTKQRITNSVSTLLFSGPFGSKRGRLYCFSHPCPSLHVKNLVRLPLPGSLSLPYPAHSDLLYFLSSLSILYSVYLISFCRLYATTPLCIQV